MIQLDLACLNCPGRSIRKNQNNGWRSKTTKALYNGRLWPVDLEGAELAIIPGNCRGQVQSGGVHRGARAIGRVELIDSILFCVYRKAVGLRSLVPCAGFHPWTRLLCYQLDFPRVIIGYTQLRGRRQIIKQNKKLILNLESKAFSGYSTFEEIHLKLVWLSSQLSTLHHTRHRNYINEQVCVNSLTTYGALIRDKGLCKTLTSQSDHCSPVVIRNRSRKAVWPEISYCLCNVRITTGLTQWSYL